jgi:hypothetical protein
VLKELHPKFKPTEILGFQTLSVKAASVEIEARPAIEGDSGESIGSNPTAERKRSVDTVLLDMLGGVLS